MPEEKPSARDQPPRSLTTRRGFLSGLAGSALGLAGVWRALGMLSSSHGSHSHGGAGEQLTPDQFQSQLVSFIGENKGDDGVVEPPHPSEIDRQFHGRDDISPVYLGVMQWAYRPAELRLEAGVTYMFHMMSLDVTHGASIHLDTGSRMHRLPPGEIVTATLTFEEPGEYPVYCSYYCGQAHNKMGATIRVVEGPEQP